MGIFIGAVEHKIRFCQVFGGFELSKKRVKIRLFEVIHIIKIVTQYLKILE
jgi:hypothetical protein